MMVAKGVNSFQNNKFQTLSKRKTLQTTIVELIKIAESCPNEMENTVGKGEIARHEQFLFFPQCFQKTCIVDT